MDEIAQGAHVFIEGRAALDIELFGGGDLDVVDELPAPDAFDERVIEAESEDVLGSFFGQVMIDAEDLLLLEMAGDELN